MDLQNKGPKLHQNFEENFARALDAHTPRIAEVLRGNH